jgi:ribosomal protein S18 acetylase RimI-like enzyme
MRFFRLSHRILPAHPAEAAILAGVYQRAWAGCDVQLDARFLEDQLPSVEEVATWFRGGFEIYRTLHDEQVVGVVRLSFPAGACHLDRLAVASELRRRGHGRALVEHSVNRARRAGAARIWAQVSPKLEEAAAFFHNLGFREAARNRPAWCGEPLVLLELSI